MASPEGVGLFKGSSHHCRRKRNRGRAWQLVPVYPVIYLHSFSRGQTDSTFFWTGKPRGSPRCGILVLFHSILEGRKYAIRPRPVAWHWCLNGGILPSHFRKKDNGLCIILVENPSQTKLTIKKDASAALQRRMHRRRWPAAGCTPWSFWEVTRLPACPTPLTCPSWSLEIHSLSMKKNIESLFMNVMV